MKCPQCDIELDVIVSMPVPYHALDMKVGCPRCKIIWSGQLEIEEEDKEKLDAE